MGLDPEARRLIEILDERFPPVETLASVAAARAAAQPIEPPEVEAVAATEEHTLDGESGVRVRCYWPGTRAARRPAVVYFHGGGWVLCKLDTHDGACRRLTNALDSVIVSVDYRLAPEHRFPAAVEDAWTAVQWVLAHADELGV